MSMEETETSQRLNTIREHLTRALSSDGTSDVDLSKAYDELLTIESGESHRLIAREKTLPRLLISFLSSEHTHLFRRRAGILVARLCHKSVAVATLFPKLVKKHGTHPFVYGIGNLIHEQVGREDLKLICGLIIRSCVYHGVDHRIFWPTQQAPAFFPIDDSPEWADQFYQFTNAFDRAHLDDSKGYSLSSIKELPEFTSRGRLLQRLIRVPNGIAVVALCFDISHVQFLDIPFSQLLALEKDSLQIKLHFEDTTIFSINATISKTRQLTLRFTDSGVTSAALQAIESALDHPRTVKAARSPQRFSTTAILDLSVPTSTPVYQRRRLVAFTETLDVSLQPSAAAYNLRHMSGATDVLARRRAARSKISESSPSIDPSLERNIAAKSAIQSNIWKPDQITVPEKLPTQMAGTNENETADSEIIAPVKFPKSGGPSAATLFEMTTTRNSQKTRLKIGREASKLVPEGAEFQTQKTGQDNRKATQSTSIKKPGEKSGNVTENRTTTQRPSAVDMKQKIDGKASKNQKTYLSNDAFNPSLYELPRDGDDDVVEMRAPKLSSKKRGPGRSQVQPSSKSKTVANPRIKKSRAPTQHSSQNPARPIQDDSSAQSDGPDDNSDDDFRGTISRGRDSQRKSKRRSSRVKKYRARQEASRSRGPSKLREQISQPKSQEQAAEGVSEVPGLDDVEPENKTPPQDKPFSENQVPVSDVYGAQSRPASQQQQSQPPKPEPAKDLPDDVQPASEKEHRGESDEERQGDQVFDEFIHEVLNQEDVDSRFVPTGKTTNVGAKPVADSRGSKAAERPKATQEVPLANNSNHDAVSAPATEGFINPAVIALVREGAELERDAVATGTISALDHKEQLKQRTNQAGEANREAVETPSHSPAWWPDSDFAKKHYGNSSQPDPNRSLFAANRALGNTSQPNSSKSSVILDRHPVRTNTASEEREAERKIDGVQQTHDNTTEAVNSGDRGIEEVEEVHTESTELPLVHEGIPRNPRFIDFDPIGPQDKGMTPPGFKTAPQNHQDSHSFRATLVKTPSNTMNYASNKMTPITRGPIIYGSGPSRRLREYASFDELNQSTDERNRHRKEKSLEDSRTKRSSDVGSAVEDIFRRETLSVNREQDSEDELARPIAPYKSNSLQGAENPAIKTGMDIKSGQTARLESDDDEDDDFADTPAFLSKADVEPSQSIVNSLVETEVGSEVRLDSLLERRGEFLPPYQSTSVRQTGSDPFCSTMSKPSSRNLDVKPASEAVSSPVEAISSHFVLTPSATNRKKRRREDSVEDNLNLPNQNLSLSPHEMAQPAQPAHYSEVRKKLDISENPYKRTKVDNRLSPSPHEAFSRRLLVPKKTGATAPSVPFFKQAALLQTQTSTTINDDGSPEPHNDPQRSKFNIERSNRAKKQAQLYQSPVLTRARNESSPSSSRGILSSNKKKLPDPPTASSKAITTHAPEDMLKQSKLLNTPAKPEADPFSSPETPKNGESKFVAMLRQKAEAQGVKSADGKQDRKTPGLEALINARYEEDEDPDKTLVNDENMETLPDFDSDMSYASTLDEDEEEDDDLHLKNYHPGEMDWEVRLKPHQQNYAVALSRISERLVRHLVDQEVAIEDIIAAFEHDGNCLIEEMERAHQEEFELEQDTVNKAKAELENLLEHMGGKLRNDKQLFEARKQKLRHEAETSDNAPGGLKQQVRVLEGILTELQ